MFRTIFVLVALLGLQAVAPAQVLSSGTVSGNTYSNTDLGITYNFPAGWSAALESDHGVLDVRFTPSKPDGSEIEIFVLDSSVFPTITPLRINRKTDAGVTYVLEGEVRNVKIGAQEFLRCDWTREAGKKGLSHSRLAVDAKGWRMILFFTGPKRNALDHMISALSSLQFEPARSIEGSPGPIFQPMNKKLLGGKLLKGKSPEPPRATGTTIVQHPVLSPVLLQAVIGTDGKIKDLEPISGNPKFVGPAMDAVRQWEYQPYVLDGGCTRL